MGHSRPLSLFFVFSINSKQMFIINIADDWIRTEDLWYWKQPLYQLSYHHNPSLISFFKKMGRSRPLFVYFPSFLVTISMQIEKSIDGVLEIRTRCCRMVGADKTTELWRPHISYILSPLLLLCLLAILSWAFPIQSVSQLVSYANDILIRIWYSPNLTVRRD